MKNRNKRFTSVVAASMALAAIAPVAPVFAAQYSSDDIKASSAVLTSDETSAANLVFTKPVYDQYEQTYTTTVAGYTEGLTGNVVIPSTVNLKVDGTKESQTVTVVGIEEYAFQNATPTSVDAYRNVNNSGFDGIVSVTIPSSVTSIGKYAFNGCENLAKVVINGSATTIDRYAFANNDNLSSVVLNGVTAMGQGVFARDYSLTSVDLPDSLTVIGNDVFYQCSNLTSIGELPSGLTQIKENAFLGTQISGEIAIPASVTYIGPNAFQTAASNLTLMLPAAPAFSFTTSNDWFGTQNGTDSYVIYGYQSETEIQAYYGFKIAGIWSNKNNLDHYKQRPVLTATRLGTDDQPVLYGGSPITIGDNGKTAMTINLGDSVKIVNTNKIENGTLVIDGVNYTMNASNKWTYTLDTPALGTHTIYMVNKAGIKSAELTITVVADNANEWVKYVTKPITVEYGSVADIDFATPLKGTAVYLFSDALNGKYTTTEPTEVGDYFVKAIVNPGADYVGLDAKAVVNLTIVQATNEWTEDLTVTDGVASAAAKFGTVVYTYYDAEGKELDAAPTEAGDYSVVASVAETDNYTGLTSEAVDYTIEATDQGWVQNEDGTWSYQDGKDWVMNGIVALPVENGSEETEDFWFVDGVMQKGWYESNSDKQHYFSSVSGAMLKNRWVSVDKDGNYVDWKTNPGDVAAYYYVDAKGNVVKDVFKYDQACTYGEGEADGHYYAFAKDGAMLTGFQPYNGKTYYFSPRTGIMKTGWGEIDGKWYYFYEDGAMATNTTIDGWYVDADGVWDGK